MPATPPLAPHNAPRWPGFTGEGAGAAMAITENQILDALRTVRDPDNGADIVTLGMVSGVVVRDGNVGFAIEVEPTRGARLEPLRKEAEQAIEALPGVLSVTAVLTAETGARAGAGRGPSQVSPHAAAPSTGPAQGRRGLAPGVRA